MQTRSQRLSEDDPALALPWLSEREPSMLIAEGPPSDAFDGLLSQWLTSAQPGEAGRGSASTEGTAGAFSSSLLQPDPLQPLPLGGGGAFPDAPEGFEPFSSRLSSLLQLGPANGAYGHQDQNSWEQIPLFSPDYAAQRPSMPNMAPPSLSALPPRGPDAMLREASSSPAPTGGMHQPQRSWSSGSGSDREGSGKRVAPRFTSGMLQAAVSTAQWPITSLASSLGESSKAILSAPMDIAMTGARMGSGLVWGAVDGGVDGAKRAWRRRNQSEESRQKERARNRRAQKRFREKQKQRQLERRDTVLELKERLEALATEKTALASRNAILEKVFSMRAHVDSTVGEHGALDQSTVDFADVFGGEDTPSSISLTLRSGQSCL